MIRLYAFLGNHGREYRGNRHNVAWQLAEHLPVYGELSFERKFKGRYAQWTSPNGRIWFLFPETYMNLSGDAISEAMRFFHVAPDELLAIHDDLELPFGSFGFKFGGGLGGHNGLRSIESRLGTRDFARLRIGIGRPDHADIAGYVLSDFSPRERDDLECAVFPKAADAVGICINEGFAKALALFPKVRCLD